MKRIRVFLIACLVFVFTGGGLFATGMPVIDISAITQAITEAVAAVQRWNQQLNQWKSEYDRLKQASEKISSGDFTAVVMGIGQLAGQLSGWADYAGLGRAEDMLDSVKDGSYSLLSMLGNTKLMVANFEILQKNMERNMKRIEEESRNDAELIGDSTFEAFSFDTKALMNLLQNGGNAVISGANLYNDVVNALFKVSPEELAEIYDNTMDKALQQSGYDSVEALQKAYAEMDKKIYDEQQKLAKMNKETNAAAYAQQETVIDELRQQKAQMESLLKWVSDMQTEKAKLINQQKDYNAFKADAEAVATQKTKDAYAAQLESSMSRAVNQAVLSSISSLAESAESGPFN